MKRRPFTFGGMVLTASLLMVAPMALVGCQDSHKTDHRESVGLSVSASHSEILVGEVVTFTAHTSDTLGRDVDLKWTSTGGDLDVQRGNRIARVKFNEVGTYSVKADMYLNDNLYKSESKVVTVKPLR